MVDDVKQALRPVEQQWGIKVHEFGFSTFSPTPETLEITQLQKLADEKLSLYRQFHDEQKLSSEAAVSLISGAVMALPAHRAGARAGGSCSRQGDDLGPAGRRHPPSPGDSSTMSLNSLFNLSFRILRWVWHILLQQAQQHPWAVLAGLYGLARAFGVMIQSGQRGILFRWGRVVKELEPGFHWLVPLMHTARKTPVRSVTMVLPDQKVMTADGLVYDVQRELRLPGRRCDQGPDLGRSPRYRLPVRDSDRRHRDPQTYATRPQLVDRVLLDRELTERIHDWVARWGLVIEQAGFTSIAPNRSVLHTTQLRPKTMERAGALRQMIDAGLDPASALVMIGAERHPVAKTSCRYHRGAQDRPEVGNDQKKTEIPIV